MKWLAVTAIWVSVAAIELLKMWRHEADSPVCTLVLAGAVGTLVVGWVDHWSDR